MVSVIDQVKLRNMAEKTGSYSHALNHLQNEIHAVCFNLHRKHPNSTSKRITNYTVHDVVEFLRLKDVPNDIVIEIRDLFDRRNVNPISHPGSDEHMSWDVTRQQYLHYHNSVGECLKYILQ